MRLAREVKDKKLCNCIKAASKFGLRERIETIMSLLTVVWYDATYAVLKWLQRDDQRL